jgi:hypothetical protein
MNEGEEGDELEGPDVHRGRIRDVDADDGEKCENDDGEDEDGEEQRLTEDDARRRIILADAAELNPSGR